MTTRLNLAVISILVLSPSVVQAQQNGFESIREVDFSHFLNPPKLPWGVDPFLKSPGFAQVSTTDDKFVLNGVLYSRVNPMAIINGKSVKIGDTVGDRQVQEIGENFVILKHEDSEVEINLPPNIKIPKKSAAGSETMEFEE